jgi:hypothetical protein
VRGKRYVLGGRCDSLLKRRDKVGEAEIGRIALLLTQTRDFLRLRYSLTSYLSPLTSKHNDIIPITIGIEEFK